MIDDLAEAISSRRVMLFAGSGISVNLGLPSWSKLMEYMARELEVDQLSVPSDANYMTLAEYYRLRHGSIGPLRSWMDRKFSAAEGSINESEVHRLIVQLDFPLIYTTNFDRNLEEAYKIHQRPYVKIINAKDVALATQGVTQIVKFHGDFDDDQSLVLAETAYFDRLGFDSPLDVKLRADALGLPILFIGYSLSDVNIRLLLHNLWRTWRRSGYERERPRSYVFMIKPDPVQAAVLEQWGIATITEPDCEPKLALEAFLRRLATKVESLRSEATAKKE